MKIKKILEISKRIIVMICLFLIGLAICMRSELNPISKRVPTIDSDVYIYIGKEMNSGKIVYKDLIGAHKGPLFNFIEYIGVKISFYKYIGVWLIELISMFITLMFLYKTSKVITKNKLTSLAVVFVSAVPLSLFFINGNYPEEYALSFISIALYYMVKYIEEKKSFSKIGSFIIGTTLSCVILIKMNLISVWIVYIIALLFDMIKNKKWQDLKQTAIYFLLGLGIPIFTTIIVLAIQGNLIDCFKEYILFNFKYATDQSGDLKHTLGTFVNSIYIISLCGCVIDIIYKVIKKEKQVLQPIAAFFYAIMCMVIIVMPKNEYKHYGMILVTVYVVPLSLLLRDFTQIVKSNKNIFRTILTIIFIGYIILNLTRRDIVTYKKEVMMVNAERFAVSQTKLTQYIKENTNEEDSIIVLGNECNIYLMSERNCNCKHYYQIPIVRIDPKIADETIEEIKENKPKLVILKLTEYVEITEAFYKYQEEVGEYEEKTNFNNYIVYELKE